MYILGLCVYNEVHLKGGCMYTGVLPTCMCLYSTGACSDSPTTDEPTDTPSSDTPSTDTPATDTPTTGTDPTGDTSNSNPGGTTFKGNVCILYTFRHAQE